MSSVKKVEGSHEIPLQGPHWRRAAEVIGPTEAQKSAVPPLRLVGVPRGRIFEIRQLQTVIGRHVDADLQLIQAEVSRRHCRLFYAADQWHLEDLGSINGTHVNGQRVERTVLHQNDVIRIAAYLFQVDLGLTAAPQSKETDEDRTQNIWRSIVELLPEDERGDEPRRKSA